MTSRTTRSVLENRPDVLWRRVSWLWSRVEEGEALTEGQSEALVEACFRIGVHPGTEPATALVLLARAHRLDSQNPKHPYHVGLLYLRHGRPSAAVRWLTAAASLSPANHRIWAHLSSALKGLDERGPGADDSGDPKARAEAIAATVREGRDDFDPDAAEPALPLLRPGECRWTGIHDMQADGRLRGRTAERTRDALAAELESIAELADQRRGGTAAFTVLAVQWMVYGYPTATVRRLAKRLPPDDGPATRLLHLVCDLFETDRAELPARLADCLTERSLPDVLIALIHRRRLFWRPLRFPDLGAHAAAREFTDGDPARHEKALRSASRALGAEPPEPMADVPVTSDADEPDAVGPDERLVGFEAAAGRLNGLIGDAQTHAKALAKGSVGDAADYARVLGDKETLAGMVDRLEALRLARLETLQRFKALEPAGLVMPFEVFHQRLEECEALFQQSPGSLRTILNKKVGRKLAPRQKEFGTTPAAPSDHVLALQGQLSAMEGEGQEPSAGSAGGPETPDGQGIANAQTVSGSSVSADSVTADSAASGRRPSPPPPPPALPADANPRERVAHAVAVAEHALDANFVEAWQTLDIYPAEAKHREAVSLLRAYLGGQQAEAELRLGRTTAARRGWGAMLTDDPLHPAVLRNLAVAHTTSGDLGPAAQTWSRYLEALYLRDLLNGDIRRGATERAEVHRVLAGSFGTAPLCASSAPDGELDGDLRQMAPVLAAAGKVEIAVTHLRLEELNHTLSQRGPTLLLGVGRSVGEAELDAARDRRTAAVETAVQALPARVRGPFEKQCRRMIDEAHREASETQGRTRRPGDEAEERAHLEWTRGRILWKLRIAKAVMGADADWPLTEYSGDVIANLRLIDELPLDPADEVLLRSVHQLGVQGDPKEFVERHNQLSDLAGRFALGQIFAAAEETASGTATRHFPDRFRRTCRSWGRNADAIPDEYADHLDDPERLYHPSARSAFAILAKSGVPGDDRERAVVEAAVTGLERWVERLPGATGPARALARLLGSLDRHDEVLEVLSRAEREAFSARGRERLAVSFVRLDIGRGEFAEAVQRLRTLLKTDSDSEQLRRLLADAYNRWIGSGKRVPTAWRITEDFARWTDAETVQNRRMLVVSATMALHRDRPEGPRAGALAADLRELCVLDPGNVEARYHLVVALYGWAWEVREQIRSAAGQQRRTLSEQLAAARAECEECAVELLGPGARSGTGSDTSDTAGQTPDSAPGTLTDEQRRDKVWEILRAVRPATS
ncbi:tetratricopeptide (TPR) repeat protein [Streptomyces umbrinus]|uniref:hypothetical protein n=1 Tax=Streptomyces umbrinus TaxID=67370 RepID=UPI00167CBEC3|nr:hypothetical protein [Streptomyces umbrinus]MCR3726435.1 tetratricopeptide (TPR) repeat protein [Streptomyces umbrinus]MCX4561858.1 hypothetical protein [Streptomyces phaeochromogenes]GHH32729.1 hypothetical protein GCM10018775_02750 [Streptomyces umbrinus]